MVHSGTEPGSREWVKLHEIREGEVPFQNRWEWFTITIPCEQARIVTSLRLDLKTCAGSRNGLQIGHFHIGVGEYSAVLLK